MHNISVFLLCPEPGQVQARYQSDLQRLHQPGSPGTSFFFFLCVFFSEWEGGSQLVVGFEAYRDVKRGGNSLEGSHIYIYIYMYVHIYIYIYMFQASLAPPPPPPPNGHAQSEGSTV